MVINTKYTVAHITSIVLAGFLLPLTVSANSDKLSVSGFGTLATATSDTRVGQFRSDRAQPGGAKKDGFDFGSLSVLGVQLEYEFNDKLDAVGQFVYREQDKQTLDSTTQLAFLRYRISPEWQIKLGRTGADLFQFSDTRDISISYPWTKVPTEVYGIVPARSFDGIDVTYSKPFPEFTLLLKGFVGSGESDFSGPTYRPISFEDLYAVSATLDAFDWKFGLKYSVTNATNDNPDSLLVLDTIKLLEPIWPGASSFSDELRIGGAEIHYSSVHFSKLFDSWELSGELAHIDSESTALRYTVNGYMSLSYFMGAHTYYFIGSFADSDPYYLADSESTFPVIPQTKELERFIDEIANNLSHNQTTASVGWRWDFSETLAFKVQFERTDYEERGSGLRVRDTLTIDLPKATSHTLFFALSFSF